MRGRRTDCRQYYIYEPKAQTDGTRNAQILAVVTNLRDAKNHEEAGVIFSYLKKGNRLVDEQCEGPTKALELQTAS